MAGQHWKVTYRRSRPAASTGKGAENFGLRDPIKIITILSKQRI
jgi:hypothetical protein